MTVVFAKIFPIVNITHDNCSSCQEFRDADVLWVLANNILLNAMTVLIKNRRTIYSWDGPQSQQLGRMSRNLCELLSSTVFWLVYWNHKQLLCLLKCAPLTSWDVRSLKRFLELCLVPWFKTCRPYKKIKVHPKSTFVYTSFQYYWATNRVSK